MDLKGRPIENTSAALDRLYNDHHITLRKFLRARLAVGQELDDIVQEVFAKLARMDDLVATLPPGEPRNGAYLCRMANNLVLNLERHKKVRRRYQEGEKVRLEQTEAAVVGPETQAQSDEELKRVGNALLSMEPLHRQAFYLNRFKQKSYAEVAASMGVSVKKVEYYMKQALIALRRAMVNAEGSEQ